MAVVKDSTQRNNWTQLVWPPDKKDGKTTHDPYYKFVYCLVAVAVVVIIVVVVVLRVEQRWYDDT